jgi:hypothetical protein
MIPIQITDNGNYIKQNYNLINNKPGAECNGFNGKLNSWHYGLSPEFKDKMENLYRGVGILAQFDTINSPYYTHVNIDENYINFLKKITN